MLEWSRNHPIFVVTLARPELLDKRPTWGAGLRAFTSIYLEPLSRDAMAELLDGLVPGLPDGVREQILERAEGVPLYAVETVRMLLDRGLLEEDEAAYRVTGEISSLEVPETLHALIAARLDGLGEAERALLQDAAVLGKTFGVGILAAVNGSSEEAIEPLLVSLVRKEVLSVQSDPRSPEHGQYGFLQDLVRRVAYDTLSRRDRKSRHLAAAQHLAEALGEDEFPEVLASHLVSAYEAAPDADDAGSVKARAARTFTLAGERAASLAAAGEAQKYYERAADLSDDPELEAHLVDRAGQMAYIADRHDDARSLLDRARAAYETQGNAVAAALVDAALAELDFLGGHPPLAVSRVAPALEAMEREGSEEDIAVLAAQLGRFLIFTGDNEAALAHLERALTLAESHGLYETFAQALNSKSVIMGRSRRPWESRVLVEGALAVALDHELHRAALRAYNNLIANLWVNDDWAQELAMLDEGLALARRIGDRQWEISFMAGSVGGLVRLGRWDEGLALAAQARELVTTEFARGLMLGTIEVHLWRGELEAARELLTQNADIGRSENADFASGWATFEARVLAAELKFSDALDAARRALSYHDHGPQSWVPFSLLEIADWASDDAIVREVLALVDSATTGPTRGVRAQTARVRARLPEYDTDAELATAERLFRELDAQFHVALVLAQRGELDEARETFERLGATAATASLASPPSLA